jgi:hypothetical protein
VSEKKYASPIKTSVCLIGSDSSGSSAKENKENKEAEKVAEEPIKVVCLPAKTKQMVKHKSVDPLSTHHRETTEQPKSTLNPQDKQQKKHTKKLSDAKHVEFQLKQPATTKHTTG